MLYAHFNKIVPGLGVDKISGHTDNVNIKKILNDNYMDVTAIKVDGDELQEALTVLNTNGTRRVFTFVGDDAKTIAANWCSNRHFH
jgi:hypothetical protein